MNMYIDAIGGQFINEILARDSVTAPMNGS